MMQLPQTITPGVMGFSVMPVLTHYTLYPQLPSKHIAPRNYTHPSSTSIISSFRQRVLYQLQALPSPCICSITKLSAQIKEEAQLTAGEHFHVPTQTPTHKLCFASKEYIKTHHPAHTSICPCTPNNCSSL